MKRLVLGVLSIAVAHLPMGVMAQSEFPSRPIRFVVPFGPGSATDAAARIVAHDAAKTLGQPIVVDNLPGANGMIGAQAVARAAADGHTVLMGGVTINAMNVSLFKKLTYNPQTDFAPVTSLGTVAFAVVVAPSFPANDVKELVAYAKANPGKLSFGSGSASSRIAGEMLKTSAGIDMLHVPYKSSQQALSDLVGGSISLAIIDLAATLPYIRSGRLKGLAVTSDRRVPYVPQLPTMIESGLPYELIGWIAAYVPATTSPAIIEKLNAALTKALTAKDTLAAFESLALLPVPSTPAELATFTSAEEKKWAAAIKAAGIEAE